MATLARRFAPVLVFSDKAQGYPTTAQEYYAAGGCMSGLQPSGSLCNAPWDLEPRAQAGGLLPHCRTCLITTLQSFVVRCAPPIPHACNL